MIRPNSYDLKTAGAVNLLQCIIYGIYVRKYVIRQFMSFEETTTAVNFNNVVCQTWEISTQRSETIENDNLALKKLDCTVLKLYLKIYVEYQTELLSNALYATIIYTIDQCGFFAITNITMQMCVCVCMAERVFMYIFIVLFIINYLLFFVMLFF